ncbi:MAG TPA: MFS transporter [Acetobacteraceae bacterium]|nr:MFS transporter [Acetobacteraceae bacterium]
MSQIAALPNVATRASEFRAGWSVVLACFCVATFAWGFGFYGQSVYLAELHATRGWPTSLIASATTVNYLTGALLLTRVHRAIEVLGPRLLLAGGVTIMAAGAMGLSAVQAPWQLYLCSVVMAIGWAGTTTTAIALTLACWFDRRRGVALSLALTGASAGGFTIAPLLVRLVHHMGLEQAVTLLALGGLAVLLPMVLAGVGRVPPGTAQSSHATASVARNDTRTAIASQVQALRSRHFWSVALPFALALAAQVGFIVHQVSFLLPRLGSGGAGVAIAATAIAAAVGRLAFAPLIDGWNQRAASAASFASQAVGLGLILALPDRPEALTIGSVVFGLSVGNVITLPALIVQREFAPQSFGVVVGLSSMVGQATLACGPTLLGIARDLTGSYDAAIGLCIGLQLVAAVLVLAREVRPLTPAP